MQKLIIKCPLCDLILAQVEKGGISDEDKAFYQEGVKCDLHPDETPQLTIE